MQFPQVHSSWLPFSTECKNVHNNKTVGEKPNPRKCENPTKKHTGKMQKMKKRLKKGINAKSVCIFVPLCSSAGLMLVNSTLQLLFSGQFSQHLFTVYITTFGRGNSPLSYPPPPRGVKTAKGPTGGARPGWTRPAAAPCRRPPGRLGPAARAACPPLSNLRWVSKGK